MHMSVEEFVGSKETKKDIKDVKRRSSVLNQGLVKSRLQGKKVKKGTYLNDQELNCWSEGLSLTDREFSAIKKSVQNCFTPSPLLCMSENTTQSRSVNTSLNTSRTTACFALSLDKWVSHQVVRMPPRIIKSSHTSENFMSTLEFIDLIRTIEGMGQSYDLEMRTYLNRDDIKPIDQTKVNRDTSGGGRRPISSSGDSPQLARKSGTKRKRFINDSDEDDFMSEEKDGSTSTEHTSTITCTVSPNRGNKEVSAVGVHDKKDSTSKEDVHASDGQDPPIERSRISLTQSGHVVPRAPSEDDLDWLDDLEPSQVYNAGCSLGKTPSFVEKRTVTESPNLDFCEEDFEFKTPILPVSKSKLRPSKCSTPASLVKVHPSTSNDNKDCNLFDNLPAHAIFDDFSISCLDNSLQSDKVSSSDPQTAECETKHRNNW